MTCPICQEKSQPRYSPFCSRRCADLDLSHWLDGSYAIQTEEPALHLDSDAENGAQPKH